MAARLSPHPDSKHQNIKITVVLARGVKRVTTTFFSLHFSYLIEFTVSHQLQMKKNHPTCQKAPHHKHDCVILKYREHNLKGSEYPKGAVYSSVSTL